MYRPLWLNLTSDIEEMISEKNDRLLGSSGSSKTVVGGEKGGENLIVWKCLECFIYVYVDTLTQVLSTTGFNFNVYFCLLL